jgi:hypothetical protein
MISLAHTRATLAGIGAVAVSVITAAAVGLPASAQTLVWSVVPSPSPATINTLYGVSCISATACTAVGYQSTNSSGGGAATLIESWDGTGWSVVPSPSPSATGDWLSRVSCVSATACMAVGFQSTSGTRNNYATLTESWDGRGWSVVPSPSPSATRNFLSDVSCLSATACTAVGKRTVNGHDKTLIESWNGTTWSVAPSPNPAKNNNSLGGVSCISATSCTAVGSYDSGLLTRGLIESWNGTRWSKVFSPRRGFSDFLSSVSCVSATACTAVGVYKGGPEHTSIESWNGTNWSVVPSPSRDSPELNKVSCSSATACTAVGSYSSGGTNMKTLIMALDGTTWSVVPSPSRGPRSNLNGVSCISATSCTAAGTNDTTGSAQSRTLIESGVASG